MNTEVNWSGNIYLTNAPYLLAKKGLESRKTILFIHISTSRGLSKLSVLSLFIFNLFLASR